MATDNNEHGHHDVGGHEIDAVDSRLLFRVTFGLSAITLVASIVVAQWFYRQRAELAERRAVPENMVTLKEHRARVQEELNGIGSTVNEVSTRNLLHAEPAAIAPAPTEAVAPSEAVAVPNGAGDGDQPAAEAGAGDSTAEVPADTAAH